jgi:hypothetical protein
MRWLSRIGPPGSVRELRPRGERLLAYAFTADGEPVIATDRALAYRDGSRTVRLGWAGIEHVLWRDNRLAVRENGADGATHTLDLPEPGRLTDIVYDRVTASILISKHTPLRGDLGVRVVARREPRGTDVTWHIRFDDGLDPADPELSEAADRFLADTRAAFM